MLNEKTALASLIGFLEGNPDFRQRYQSEIQRFRSQLEQAKLDRYRLGVIGVTSSGKSTMINAIMKRELLSTGVQPTSSQLVTCSKSSQRQVTVYFEDKAPEVVAGKPLASIIRKYGDERYNPGNRLGVKQLEVSSPDYAFPEEILLIDSPGLDAYGFESHEKLTMNSLLPTIDFCIFVTTCKTNSDRKMQSVLDTVAEYDRPLIIVQNMIDSIRPSPDGKKSVKMVAEEHLQRVQRIVDRSGIKSKRDVRIIQISAKLALEAYTGRRLKADERRALLERSNFTGLVNAVTAVWSEIRPGIEHRRMTDLRAAVTSIVQDAKNDLQATEAEMKELRFEFEGSDKKIEQTFLTAQSGLQRTLRELEQQRKRYLSRKDDFTEADIRNIRGSADSAGQEIISITSAFREKITEYCSMFHTDARRLRVLDSFGKVPGLELRTKKESRRVKKSGIFSGVKRFFGRLFDTDWGYEYVTEDIYDHQKTLESITGFYDKVISSYTINCGAWEDSARTQTNALLAEYQNRADAHEERKNSLLGKAKLKEVITGLEKLLAGFPGAAEKKQHTENISIQRPEFKDQTIQVSLNRMEYSAVRLADGLRQLLHRSTVRSFAGAEGTKKTAVIAWDADCAVRFIDRCFGMNIPELTSGLTRLPGYDVFIDPSPAALKPLQSSRSHPVRYFILVNTAQIGSGMSDIRRSGLDAILSAGDRVFLVVQDLDELIVGEGVKEGMINMLALPEKMSVLPQCRIMINHPNPLYNMTACQLQLTPCLTHADEISLLDDIQKRFPFLRDAKTDTTLSEIIAGFKKYKELPVNQ